MPAPPHKQAPERRWRTTAAIVGVAAVMTVLSTAATAAMTSTQEEHTLMFLQDFPSAFRSLRALWQGKDFCAWRGVTCEADDTVTVNLSNMGLEGDMPEIDGDVDGSHVVVTSVDLSNNPGISSKFESDWKEMVMLKRLDLSGTSLRGELPRDWQRMRALEYLNISGTSACRALPKWSPSVMTSLSVVDLSNCNFRGTLQDSWGSFRLTEARLSGNNFCGCVPSSWSGNAVLTAAVERSQPYAAASTCASVNRCASDAGSCDSVMSEEENTREFLLGIADEFSNQLRSVWAGANYCAWTGVTCYADKTVGVNLTGFGLDGDMPEIDRKIDGSKVLVTSVDFSGNPRLRSSFEEDWGRLKRLQYLNMGNTAMKGTLPLEWAGMASLEVLDVHNTVACRALPQWTLPKLRVVDLSSSSFYGSLQDSWSSMTTLESVRLGGNNFCGCVPASWQRVPALASAVAEGSGVNSGVVASNCASANACGKDSSTCKNVNAGTGGGGTGGGATGDDTLTFLRSFASKLPALRTTWTGTEYCTWPGVTCDGDGMVWVQLSSRGLVGWMPQLERASGANVNVVSVDLSNNAGIRGNFQSDWAGLRQLRFLNLSGTGLYGNIPDSWNGMSSLEEVRIHNTAACRGMPNWHASSLPRLRVVDFSNNPNMRGVLTSSFGSFTRLTTLDLMGTRFCGCMPTSWQGEDVLMDAAVDAGVPTTDCWQNACLSLNFVCPTVQMTAPPDAAQDPTLGVLRRLANALAVISGGRAAVSAPSRLARASLPSGQTLEQNWTGTDYCSNWVGVSCDMGTGDISLNLSSLGLSGELPSLANLPGEGVALVSMDFSNNPGVTGTFPPSWGNLSSLRVLRMNNLGIASSLPSEWKGMSSLRELTVSNTMACGQLPAWDATSMPALQVVDLSNNALSGTLSDSWGSFSTSQLVSLTLAGNGGLCGCAPDSWESEALLDGASLANPQLVSADCSSSSVACVPQAACRVAGSPASSGQGSSGGVATASVLGAWAVAACLALAAL